MSFCQNDTIEIKMPQRFRSLLEFKTHQKKTNLDELKHLMFDGIKYSQTLSQENNLTIILNQKEQTLKLDFKPTFDFKEHTLKAQFNKWWSSVIKIKFEDQDKC